MCLRKVREGEGVVNTRIAVAAARGNRYAKEKLVEFGGHVELTMQTLGSLFLHG